MLQLSSFYPYIIGLLLFWYIWSRRKYYWLSYKMNTKLGLPFFGVALQIIKQKSILNYIAKERKTFHPANGIVWFGPMPVFYCGTPDMMKKILPSNVFINKAEHYEIVGKHIGEGLFSLGAPVWNMHRKLIEPTFRGVILKDFTQIFNNEGNYLIQNFNKIADGKQGNELLYYTYSCFLDITCQTLMGKRMRFQENLNTDIYLAFRTVFELACTRIFNPFYYYDWVFYWTSHYSKLRWAQKRLNDFVYELIQDRLKLSCYEQKENEVGNGHINGLNEKKPENSDEDLNKTRKKFIDVLIECYQNKQFTWDDVESECKVVISAAFDTSGNTLNNVISMLAMHPHVQERLFAEIKSEYPEKNSDMDPDLVQKLPYLDMVINETLRLFTAVPLVGRVANSDFDLGNGLILPKRTEVMLDIFNMQRDPSIWGPNADKFDPDEHFSPENVKNLHPFAFIPFAKGVRSCVGSKYAYAGVKLMCAKIVRHFKFTTNFKYENFECRENVGIYIVEQPKIIIEKRAE